MLVAPSNNVPKRTEQINRFLRLKELIHITLQKPGIPTWNRSQMKTATGHLISQLFRSPKCFVTVQRQAGRRRRQRQSEHHRSQSFLRYLCSIYLKSPSKLAASYNQWYQKHLRFPAGRWFQIDQLAKLDHPAPISYHNRYNRCWWSCLKSLEA